MKIVYYIFDLKIRSHVKNDVPLTKVAKMSITMFFLSLLMLVCVPPLSSCIFSKNIIIHRSHKQLYFVFLFSRYASLTQLLLIIIHFEFKWCVARCESKKDTQKICAII